MMSKLVLLLLVAVVASIEALPAAHDSPSSTAAPNNCMANSVPITSRGDTNCVLNCANYPNRLTMACTRILQIGAFCRCNEGFVFKSGAEGECVRIADCPAQS